MHNIYTVLVADDEYLIRDSLIHMIETEIPMCKVIGEAANGREAVALAGKLFPDIVITDIKMPVMNGIELIEHLHREQPQIQTVILSGYSDFEYARQALQLYVRDYVLKPIKPDMLRIALERCIRQLEINTQTTQPEESQAEKMIRFIDETFMQQISLEQIAEEFNYSPKYISSLVKAETGQSFTDYVLGMRIARAIDLLTKSGMEIKEIAAAVGYDDQQYFHRVFKKKTGMTPMQYRRK